MLGRCDNHYTTAPTGFDFVYTWIGDRIEKFVEDTISDPLSLILDASVAQSAARQSHNEKLQGVI